MAKTPPVDGRGDPPPVTAPPAAGVVVREHASKNTHAVAERLLRSCDGVRKVLDMPAGEGAFTRRLVGDYDVTAADVQAVPPIAGSTSARADMVERLPWDDGAFDAAMAVLTLHHWNDWRAGVAEMQRVAASRVVLLTWDPEAGAGFWLLEYFPGIRELDRARFPEFEALLAATGGESHAVPVPHDCSDGFLGAWWRRPSAYLDDAVRSAMSGFALLPADDVERGLARLSADTHGGEWERRFGALRDLEELDLGYRLVVAGAT